MAAEEITIDDLTEVKLDGNGVFDKLLQTTRLQLKQEFDSQRLKGQEYAQVLTAAITAVLQNAVIFLLQKDEAANKAALVEAQIALTEAQKDLVLAQIEREQDEKELTQAKVQLTLAQATLPAAEIRRIDSQITSAGFADLLTQAQTEKVQQDVLNAIEQVLLTKAQTAKITQDTTNAVQELQNLIAQECLLRAQYDLTMEQKLNMTAQTTLVQQKTATERAQVIETGVDENSVIGRQKALYKAQSDGFLRDAEQKAAKILADTWNVRRTTDDGTVADATNMLYDPSIGRAITKLLTGIQA